jgi:hypothetical protein
VREVASRTEIYWCPIKHARRVLGPHPHYQGFGISAMPSSIVKG